MLKHLLLQADAAAQMSQLLGPDPTALDTYAVDALSERLSKAVIDLAAVHASLGLPQPAVPVSARGVAHVVGPLVGCSGQSSGAWDPSYEVFVTGSAGGLALQAKGQGTVAVTPYRYCEDAITNLQLTLSVSNLGPAMGVVSVSPVAMLAQVGGSSGIQLR